MPDPETFNTLIGDALTLVREAVGPRMVKLAERIALDPEGWGLTETFDDEPITARDLAETILGYMTSYIYDAGDENTHDGADREAVREFFYALAEGWRPKLTP